MVEIFELLKKTSNLFLFVVALSQILLYETCVEKIVKVELLWRFLVNFGA